MVPAANSKPKNRKMSFMNDPSRLASPSGRRQRPPRPTKSTGMS
jgi:hypothetical protein